MLKYNEANLLNVHQLRRVEHCPPHFTKVTFSLATSEKNITDWIWENLTNRFYLGDVVVAEDNGTQMCKCAGFEEEGEASYFALMLDTINKYE